MCSKKKLNREFHSQMHDFDLHICSPPQIIEQLDLESKHHFVYFYEPNYSLLPQDHKYRQNFIELLHVCFLFCACFFSFLKLFSRWSPRNSDHFLCCSQLNHSFLPQEYRRKLFIIILHYFLCSVGCVLFCFVCLKLVHVNLQGKRTVQCDSFRCTILCTL